MLLRYFSRCLLQKYVINQYNWTVIGWITHWLETVNINDKWMRNIISLKYEYEKCNFSQFLASYGELRFLAHIHARRDHFTLTHNEQWKYCTRFVKWCFRCKHPMFANIIPVRGILFFALVASHTYSISHHSNFNHQRVIYANYGND